MVDQEVSSRCRHGAMILEVDLHTIKLWTAVNLVVSVKAVVRDLGKTKSGKQKAAKEARKIVEMKGKQIKDELSLAMIQLFTKLLDEDSVEASTIDDVIQGPN